MLQPKQLNDKNNSNESKCSDKIVRTSTDRLNKYDEFFYNSNVFIITNVFNVINFPCNDDLKDREV